MAETSAFKNPEGWEAVIGLEVHAQLKTRSKLFSSAPHAFGAGPNTQTTEVDVGLPGVLPVLNEKAVEVAVRLALALGCNVHPVSIFARKHYLYPDLPKGYQISQYEEPYRTDGAVPIEIDGEERRNPAPCPVPPPNVEPEVDGIALPGPRPKFPRP